MEQKGTLLDNMMAARLGQYKNRLRGFSALVHSGLNLSNVTTHDLERFCGIGWKTSRFFLLHSQKGFKGAALDVHILRFLHDFLGIDTPKQTPTSWKAYDALEREFVRVAERLGMDCHDLDIQVWNAYSSGKKDQFLRELKARYEGDVPTAQNADDPKDTTAAQSGKDKENNV